MPRIDFTKEDVAHAPEPIRSVAQAIADGGAGFLWSLPDTIPSDKAIFLAASNGEYATFGVTVVELDAFIDQAKRAREMLVSGVRLHHEIPQPSEAIDPISQPELPR